MGSFSLTLTKAFRLNVIYTKNMRHNWQLVINYNLCQMAQLIEHFFFKFEVELLIIIINSVVDILQSWFIRSYFRNNYMVQPKYNCFCIMTCGRSMWALLVVLRVALPCWLYCKYEAYHCKGMWRLSTLARR